MLVTEMAKTLTIILKFIGHLRCLLLDLVAQNTSEGSDRSVGPWLLQQKFTTNNLNHPVKTWVRKFPGHLVIINREHAPKAPLSKRLLQSLLYCYNSKIVFVMSVHVWFSRCKSRWICSRWSFGFSMVIW